ncbi:10727_t:CDS:2, partial [Funneliformis geosporum]
NEADVRNAMNFNICMVLNDFIGPDYVYSRKSTDTPDISDFNCHLICSLILVIKAKRKHVLEDMGEETFPEFYQTSKETHKALDFKNPSTGIRIFTRT